MKTNKNLIIAIIAAFAALLFLLILFPNLKKSGGGTSSKELDISSYNLASVIGPNEDNGGIGDHIKGDENAPVTIFEYADYQCSGCANLNSVVSQLLKEYDGKLRVVYRNFPLTSIHPNAIAAASAVEAAGLQGYWEEYGDFLFANQAEWFYDTGNARTERFMGYFSDIAGENGSLPTFRQDLSSAKVKKKVEFDKAISEYLKIDATPSFFGPDGAVIPWMNQELNTKDDVLNYFRKFIDAELEKTTEK